jgi:hypothetical protein
MWDTFKRRSSGSGLWSGPAISSFNARRHSSFIPQTTHMEPSTRATAASFHDVFGILGVPMMSAFALSSMAMLFTAIIQVYPDEIGNLVLGTQSLDNGDFLMFSQASVWMVAASTTMLMLFVIGYFALIVCMFSFRYPSLLKLISRPPRTASLAHKLTVRLIARTRIIRWLPRATAIQPLEAPKLSVKVKAMALKRVSSVRQRVASQVLFEFTSTEGQYHEYHVSDQAIDTSASFTYMTSAY